MLKAAWLRVLSHCRTHSAYLRFAIVGFGVSWTLMDTIWVEMPLLMAALPEGLKLPVIVNVLAQILAIVVLVVFGVLRRCGGQASDRMSQRVIVICFFAQWAAFVLMTLFWKSSSFVLYLTVIVAELTGAVSLCHALPFVGSVYGANLVSAVMLGTTLGSTISGLLGIAQQGQAVTVAPFYALFSVLMLGPLFAGLSILRQGISSITFITTTPEEDNEAVRKHRGDLDRLIGVSSPSSSSSSPLPSTIPDSSPSSPISPSSVSSSLTSAPPPNVFLLCMLMVPVNMEAWGFANSLISFAVAHTSPTCDPSDRHTVITLTWVMGLAFLALPCAAFSTTIFPTFSPRTLSLLAMCAHICFLLEALAAGKFISNALLKSVGGSILVVLVHVILRFCDTYLFTMTMRIITERHPEPHKMSQKVGMLVTGCAFVGAAVTFGMSEADALSCKPD